MPKWPTSGVTAQSGVTTRRLWGSRPAQAQLSLTFANITDDNAALILSAYHSAKGNTTELTLPDLLFSGASTTLQSWLKLVSGNTGLKWFFTEEPPTLESVSPGRSSVRVTITAEHRST